MLRTIRWRLFTTTLLAVCVPLMALAWLMFSLVWSFYVDTLRGDLQTKALIVADAVAPALSPEAPGDPQELERMVGQWRRDARMRVVIADSGGTIRAATSDAQVGLPIPDSRLPGMRSALEGQQSSTVWKSPSFDYEETLYVNVPVRQGGRLVGAVRVSYSLAQVQSGFTRLRTGLLVAVGAYAALILLLTLWVSKTIVSPVERLDRSARVMASGDFQHRAALEGTVEIRQLAETLNVMSERLAKLEGLRRRYVSDVSHELRTPLAAIRGLAETCVKHGDADPSIRAQYLPRIISQTDRLARLATQVLDLAQIESGNILSTSAPYRLEGAVEEAVGTCAGAAARAGVALATDLSPDLPELIGDRDRVVQVLINLVDNSVRHTPAGGQVLVAARAENGSVILTVRDTGSGIPAEHIPHVFDRFYRVEPSRSRESGGSGLGLAIAKSIVEAHGGRISVASEPGRGTEMTVVLPGRAGVPAGVL